MKVYLTENETIPPNSTFVCGFPSTGNVGQLAMDCILSTLISAKRVRRLGSLESKHLLPISGYECFARGGKATLCLALEMYAVNDSNLVFVQQRSPCRHGAQHEYISELLDFLKSVQYDVLLGLTGGVTEDIEVLNKRPFFYSGTGKGVHRMPFQLQLLIPEFKLLSVCTFRSYERERKRMAALSSMSHIGQGPDADYVDELMISREPGGLHAQGEESASLIPMGMSTATTLMLAALAAEDDTPLPTNDSVEHVEEMFAGEAVFLMGKLCIEGDNRLDGKKLAAIVLHNLGLLTEDVVQCMGNSSASVAKSSPLLMMPAQTPSSPLDINSIDKSKALPGPAITTIAVKLLEPQSWESLFGPPISERQHLFY